MNSTSPITKTTKGDVKILTISSTGNVFLSNSTTQVGDISDGNVFTARVVFDFDNTLIKFYGENGTVLASAPMLVPEIDIDGDDVADKLTAAQWKTCLTNYLFYWYSNNKAVSQSLRIYEVKVAAGNLFL